MDMSRTISDYLRRIGADRPAAPDAAALRDLQVRHLRTVPFENLSVHLAEEIVLEERALVAKVVDRRRGGFCYELNGAFAVLLRELGFRVTLLQARVFTSDGRLGIPYDHMTLLVETPSPDGAGGDGERWLADVGFGSHSTHPLAFDERGDQEDPAGTFRVVEAPEGDLDVLRDGKPQFRLDRRPRALADFAAGAWYHRTSPESHFTRSLVCSRNTHDGRITLGGHRLVTTADGERHERELTGDAEILATYRERFGLVLDRVPRVMPHQRKEGTNWTSGTCG
ncbi:arylamine N-acetyltransferase [Streptomyces sp. NBC_01498]|uniref:arylamine N-acetyltransferase family protein n=1 Tax=Streptomyces sp. NBC_01498 TaxID=2975870 RepID=UPI002E7BD6DD|nr:arylamine N-acetyltransferase [Streptomyces sp. NBC_01498]WTL26962.1 arylamine N-acetyltransferase [Streptomyces sp. NBC_01498]